jgi:NCAIR mutase (PurE)-related protein
VIPVGRHVRFDAGRGDRIGVPEVVLAEGKTPDLLAALLWGLHRKRHGALISRLTHEQKTRLRLEARRGLPVQLAPGQSFGRLRGPLGVERTGGTVAIVSAGTADAGVADEAEAVLRALGVRTITAHDVGVAGVHRLQQALHALERARPQVYLVFAGREGALPTVLAGLVGAPVVGVPTSVGYGRGGKGEAALTAMLQSCAPIAVVNIDAAVPAALFAAQLVRRSSPR